MARMNAAQRAAAAAAEAEARLEQERASYPGMLMDVFARATNLGNFDLSVADGVFVVYDRNDDARWTLTYAHTMESMSSLYDLQWEVEQVEERHREHARRLSLRAAALTKLTEEEREVLGL